MKRVYQLDILRGIAIILVLGRHLKLPTEKMAFYNVIKTWNTLGWIGVDLFFVLSGFLIGGLLLNEVKKTNKLQVSSFLIRRGFKIYPSFYVLIAITLVINLTKNIHFSTTAICADLFFFQNYYEGMWGHTWSLAVEEHFYLLLPLLLLLLVKIKKIKLLPVIIITINILVLAFRIYHYYNSTPIPNFFLYQYWFPTHLRIDSLLFGVLIAYYYHNSEKFKQFLSYYKYYIGIISFVLLLGCIFLFTPEPNYHLTVTIGFSIFYISFGMMLLSFINFDFYKNKLLATIANGLIWIGTSSYTIYLCHMGVRYWVVPFFNRTTYINNYYLNITVYLVMSLLVGKVYAKVVEYPFIKLREKFIPARV